MFHLSIFAVSRKRTCSILFPLKSYGLVCPAEVLNLSNLNLIGSIPEHWFNKLTLLRHVKFDSNSLTGTIPATVGYLSNNEMFDLSHNQLTGALPHQIAVLPAVYLQNNSLSSIQSFDSGAVKNVRFLMLEYNNIGGNLPDSFANLQQLEECHLEGNHMIGSIPSSIGRMTNLKHIRFHENGTIHVCQYLSLSRDSFVLEFFFFF